MTPTQRDVDHEWHAARLETEVRDPNTTLRTRFDLWAHGHDEGGEELRRAGQAGQTMELRAHAEAPMQFRPKECERAAGATR